MYCTAIEKERKMIFKLLQISYKIEMVESETLKKTHEAMLLMLDEIDRICAKYDIEWFIFYGTLLGAARHKGFIPWDDDCDIVMTRENYDKFVKVVKMELNEKKFFFQTDVTDPKYNKIITKLRMNNTKLVQDNECDNELYHQGIFVDIFIFDYYSSVSKKLFELYEKIEYLRSKRRLFQHGSLQRSIYNVLLAIPYILSRGVFKLHKWLIRKTRNYQKDKYIACEIELIGRIIDYEMHRTEVLFPINRGGLTFMGKSYPYPANYDEVLRVAYGDYMKLPPINERYSHAEKIEFYDV